MEVGVEDDPATLRRRNRLDYSAVGNSPEELQQGRQMDKLKLTYFDFDGGRGEPARLALHIGGIPFEDYRFAAADFAEVRKTTPLNQVPTLQVNDRVVTQGDAITRYAGKLAGLYPEDPVQALLCDEIMSALEDVNCHITATFGMKGDELKKAREALAAETLPRYLRWLQHQLESSGGAHFADNRLTIADLKALVMLRWLTSGMLDHIPTDLVARVAPALTGYMDRVRSTPAIAKYYERRAGG
ncbi:MAG TPA: glutathione S-transferase family protein [Aromatoleum sp.]|uniref:glutathione S-transferase family protein n=1 Tax=Aromatoleum sp. TaxID=2307007 RepID=UPI002B469D5C|nr:glutathione S-transferase family protein [Aromatoleum sp.]HJV26932.1 glutathione S-transferase family protein [Aromatoleum sp.]